ncbi:hypothetical protein BJ508DRAFT_300334 [Ascobolus immersus RN42]|uniref:Uncharacterized protein n=1 Tax=Ascobolus immersus RN42 TaxID=1160509 RepID=A0A3N4IRA4_ASCIM|nr:hypothetical protein BJ508DRAFT_300334 [Ascobolus immersus RN42]
MSTNRSRNRKAFSIDAATTALQSITLNEPKAPSSPPVDAVGTEHNPARISHHSANPSSLLPTISPDTNNSPASHHPTISSTPTTRYNLSRNRPRNPPINWDFNNLILNEVKKQRRRANKRKRNARAGRVLPNLDSDQVLDDFFNGSIKLEYEPGDYYPPPEYTNHYSPEWQLANVPETVPILTPAEYEAKYNAYWGIENEAETWARETEFQELREAQARMAELRRSAAMVRKPMDPEKGRQAGEYWARDKVIFRPSQRHRNIPEKLERQILLKRQAKEEKEMATVGKNEAGDAMVEGSKPSKMPAIRTQNRRAASIEATTKALKNITLNPTQKSNPASIEAATTALKNITLDSTLHSASGRDFSVIIFQNTTGMLSPPSTPTSESGIEATTTALQNITLNPTNLSSPRKDIITSLTSVKPYPPKHQARQRTTAPYDVPQPARRKESLREYSKRKWAEEEEEERWLQREKLRIKKMWATMEWIPMEE